MTIEELQAMIPNHPKTDDCPDLECMICGMRDCPDNEPLHYHHDGCPICSKERAVGQTAILGKLYQ